MAMKSKEMHFDTPSTEWIVNHGLGKQVASDVFIFNSSEQLVKMMPLEVVYVDDNSIKIEFTFPQRGMVKVI